MDVSSRFGDIHWLTTYPLKRKAGKGRVKLVKRGYQKYTWSRLLSLVVKTGNWDVQLISHKRPVSLFAKLIFIYFSHLPLFSSSKEIMHFFCGNSFALICRLKTFWRQGNSEVFIMCLIAFQRLAGAPESLKRPGTRSPRISHTKTAPWAASSHESWRGRWNIAAVTVSSPMANLQLLSTLCLTEREASRRRVASRLWLAASIHRPISVRQWMGSTGRHITLCTDTSN